MSPPSRGSGSRDRPSGLSGPHRNAAISRTSRGARPCAPPSRPHHQSSSRHSTPPPPTPNIEHRTSNFQGRPGAWAGKITFALAALLLAACANGDGGPAGPTATPAVVSGDGTVTVRAGEWYFEPSSIRVAQGSEITIVLQNEGRILHNLKLEDLDGDLIESMSSGPQEADEGELFVGAEGDGEGTLVFRPLEVGAFTYYCTLEGHRAFGMEGVLSVEPGP